MKWRFTGDYYIDEPVYECPKCGYQSTDVTKEYHFCPNCGTRLDFDEGDDNGE